MNNKKISHGSSRSSSASKILKKTIAPSHYTNVTTNAHCTKVKSTVTSTSSNLCSQYTIQMEPSLQALLTAEGRAAAMIATARRKRNELLRQCKQDSQLEIEAFRQEREGQYKRKLYQATQIEQYKAIVDRERHLILQQMRENIMLKGKSLVHYIIHRVIDKIPVEPHPNIKYITF